MPLHISNHGGVNRVGVLCDHCGEPIGQAADGNYQWQTDTEGRPLSGTVVFTHKRCSEPFEAAHGPVGSWCATELQVLPIFLGYRAGRHRAVGAAFPASLRA